VEPSETAAHAIEALRMREGNAKPSAHTETHPTGAVTSVDVNELVALESVGYEPVGVVTGSSVYEIPLRGRWANYKQNAELTVFTDGFHKARLSAFGRTRHAARTLGADGVIALDFKLPNIPKSGNEVRFSAAGLAIRSGPNAAVMPRKDSTRHPFTTSLHGHDFALLARSGYLVVGIVMGICVFHVGRRNMMDTMKNLPRNTELTVITEALYQSRELAMARMQQEAITLDSDGIVGAQVDGHTHAWGSRVIEFLAIGTGIELVLDVPQPINPSLVVQLDGSPSPLRGNRLREP
jgi:uncharacterized protein YbjQ (UPF0145 family)